MLTEEEKRIAKIWQFYDLHGKFPDEIVKDQEIEQAEKDFGSLFEIEDAIPE